MAIPNDDGVKLALASAALILGAAITRAGLRGDWGTDTDRFDGGSAVRLGPLFHKERPLESQVFIGHLRAGAGHLALGDVFWDIRRPKYQVTVVFSGDHPHAGTPIGLGKAKTRREAAKVLSGARRDSNRWFKQHHRHHEPDEVLRHAPGAPFGHP
jgi:hypothetical protein